MEDHSRLNDKKASELNTVLRTHHEADNVQKGGKTSDLVIDDYFLVYLLSLPASAQAVPLSVKSEC